MKSGSGEMTLNEYQQQAMMTCTESCNNFSYMMLNLVGEVGEFASKIGKSIRKCETFFGYDGNIYVDPAVADEIKLNDIRNHQLLEAGDILWQLSGLCKVMGWTLEEVAQANLEKLASRQKRGKIIGDGDDR